MQIGFTCSWDLPGLDPLRSYPKILQFTKMIGKEITEANYKKQRKQTPQQSRVSLKKLKP
ncbi:hypothetical protein SCA6_009870 [Theobroma cacao]